MVEWHGDDIDDSDVVAPDEGGDEAEAKLKKLRDELATTRKEKQEYMDGWQRAKADYVNALKRFDEEKKVERERGVMQAIETLLPAFDALERAKEHGELPAGFEAIARQMESAFASLELEAVGQVGEAFDPNLHDALGQDPASSPEEDGKVTAVLEKGYRKGETLVRPAKVRVAHAA